MRIGQLELDFSTPWSDGTADKLYLTSGQFTSTIKTSLDTSSVDTSPWGIRFDGTDTPWGGTADEKLYLNSGQFTSTVKDSEDVSSLFDQGPEGNSESNGNVPWVGEKTGDLPKLFLQSGKFTSTVKTSHDINSSIFAQDFGATSWDGTDTIVSVTKGPLFPSGGTEKLFLLSGQFTGTIKTSQAVGVLSGNGPSGVCWDGVNTAYSGLVGTFPSVSGKLFLGSGKFTSTIKTSQNVGSSISHQPTGIGSNAKTDS
jgi:hypothetical protein